MTKADLVENVTASIARTAGPMISKKDCARVVDAFLDAVKEAQADKLKALNPDLDTKPDDDALTDKVFDMLMDPKEEDFRKEVVIFCSLSPKIHKERAQGFLCIDDLDSSDIYIIYVQCMKFSRAGLDLKKEI